MPRDMSYRKPVPVYIPSPPPSPLTEQEESNSDEHSSQEIPPLPREWREAIERALSLSVLIPPSNHGSEESDVLNRHASININTFNVVKQPTLVRRGSTSSAAFLTQEEKRQRQRQIHRIYRPPTPPLRAHQPKRRKIGLDDEWVDSSSTVSNVYRDQHSILFYFGTAARHVAGRKDRIDSDAVTKLSQHRTDIGSDVTNDSFRGSKEAGCSDDRVDKYDEESLRAAGNEAGEANEMAEVLIHKRKLYYITLTAVLYDSSGHAHLNLLLCSIPQSASMAHVDTPNDGQDSQHILSAHISDQSLYSVGRAGRVIGLDFGDLLFLPRKSSLADIHSVKRQLAVGDGGVVDDLNAAGQRYLRLHQANSAQHVTISTEIFSEDEENDPHTVLVQNTSLKFLLAGGFAGVVSRTCTAPFDRLKVFLITRPPHLGGCAVPAKPSLVNIAVFKNAIARIYAEGGILAFWTGNGLSVAKVLPESAIKFFTYESSKRAFAKYWDNVDDPCEISGTSRFLSGGIGGISSQLSIYPVETLKTQMMTSMGHKRSIVAAIHHVWSLGGVRAYYRGLVIGLVGVFPYSAIDMSTFEALKLAYVKSTGKEQPGVLALLAFGSISGSIGAISVYPLNLVRTRLQASGSAGHPQRYSGVLDVAVKTWERDGWRGFYRGLFPTLAKVIPSVSITYTVYEYSKRRLGV